MSNESIEKERLKNLNLADTYYNSGVYKSTVVFAGIDEFYEPSRGIEDFSEAIRLNPSHVDAYYNRGLGKAEIIDFQGAIEDFNGAIRLNPNHTDAYYNRGLAKYGLGDYEGAILDFNETIRLNPNHRDACDRCKLLKDKQNKELRRKVDLTLANASLKNKLGDYQGAIEDVNETIRLKNDHPYPYYQRGYAKNKLGDYQGAIEDINEAIRLSLDHSYVYYERGCAKYELGNYQEAIKDFNKAIRLNSKYRDARNKRSLAIDKLNIKERLKMLMKLFV